MFIVVCVNNLLKSEKFIFVYIIKWQFVFYRDASPVTKAIKFVKMNRDSQTRYNLRK